MTQRTRLRLQIGVVGAVSVFICLLRGFQVDATYAHPVLERIFCFELALACATFGAYLFIDPQDRL